jgi:MFS family permease
MAMPMLVAPVAGALADRVGNRPFMFSGLALQAAGLGWLAAVARPGVAFIDGFRPAEWVAAAVAAVGVPIAALAPSKSTQEEIR